MINKIINDVVDKTIEIQLTIIKSMKRNIQLRDKFYK